jgi:signal transduction histidine kinase/ligand-binding sensor domain-containing protein
LLILVKIESGVSCKRSVAKPSPGVAPVLWTSSAYIAIAGRPNGPMVRPRARKIIRVPELSRAVVAFLLLVVGSAGRGLALDPNQPFSSYLRTRFSDEDGLPSSVVHDIVQSQDGLLWLSVGGESLARFDGRRFTVFPDPYGRVLAMAPDGDLWVGADGRLERIAATGLNQFGRLPVTLYHPGPDLGSRIICLHFTRSGILWVGTAGGLYRFERGGFSPVIPRLGIYRIEETSNGHLLVITSEGFMEWDGARAVRHPKVAVQLGVKTDEVFHVLEDRRGVTWFCTRNGVARRAGGSIEKLAPHGPKGHGAFRAYEDPQGNVWFATADGLSRATATGLELVVPGMNVRSIYGDRDGDLWIATNGDGLIRFKDRAVRMFTTAGGLPNNVIMTVLAGSEGSLWTGANCGGLSRFDGRSFRTYDEKDGLRNSCVFALAEDANRDLWIGTYGGGAFRFRDGRFTQYSKAQGLTSAVVTGIVPARDGSLWFATPEAVSRLRGGQIRNYTTADGLSSNHALNVYEDRDGDIWAGTVRGIDHLTGDRFAAVPSIPQAGVFPIGEDPNGGLYMTVASKGVFRLENHRPINVAPDIGATRMVETKEGDAWLSGLGIYRFQPADLQRLRGHDEPLDYEIFGRADGLDAKECSFGFPNSALTRDGKLWVATPQGLAMLDLPRLPRMKRKPVIYLREITVGRNVQPPGHELVLPPGTHHVELNFDAVEISSPEKIRLQYRLDGVDSEWLDTDPPGHAIYSNIPHGTHAFHVRACNRDGIWDRVGMVYSITQQPYFYETASFQLATAAAGCLLLVGFYRLRIRQAADRLNVRLEARLGERERIARDLHDTLLQSFQGLMLRFQVAHDELPGRPAEARKTLENALDDAAHAIAEGRDAVQGLRSPMVETNDLARAIGSLVEELAADEASSNRAESFVHAEGKPRAIHPILRDEIYRIAGEALRNAFRHAHAQRIEVTIAYGERQFRLRVRDDGKGIDPEVLGEKGRAGHWGLAGMRERAELIGGHLEIWSQRESGTEVALNIPASIAYVTSPARRFRLFARKIGTNS